MHNVILIPLLCAGVSQEPQVIQIHEGARWVWYARQDHFQQHEQDIKPFFEYADKAFDYLVSAWSLRPPKDKYALLVWPKTGGGFAAGDIVEVRALTGSQSPGIGVSYDAFFNVAYGIKAYWAYVLITHEMVNLFTGQIVSGGWPVDWWANHRSPFPLMTAVQIQYALIPSVAVRHAEQTKDPFVQMFVKLKDQYGWTMFKKAFALAIADGITWDSIGQNPSPLRTNYVCAYLRLGAPEDILPILEPVVPGFDKAMITDIIGAREKWRSLPENSSERKRLQAAYLRGDYKGSLDLP